MGTTNLFNLTTKTVDEIDLYLSTVSPQQFIEDVNHLVKENISGEVIEETIEKLKRLLQSC